jgi:hypothetical protein
VGPSSSYRHHFEVQDYASVALRAHTLRFGARVRTVLLQDASSQTFNGNFLFSGGPALRLCMGSLTGSVRLAQTPPSDGTRSSSAEVSLLPGFRRQSTQKQGVFISRKDRSPIDGGAGYNFDLR